MRKDVPQSRMALEIIAALQEGTCAITKTRCSVFMFDESANASSLLSHMKAQINTLKDTIQYKNLKISGSDMGLLVEKVVTYLIIIIFICALSCMRLYFYYGICLQSKQIAARQDTSIQVKPLRAHWGREDSIRF